MLERNIFNNFNFNNDNKLSAVEVGGLVPLCAELSQRIYSPGYYIPSGWSLLHSYAGGAGYKGAFYTRNLLTTNAQILVVHRGTVFDFADIMGDIQLALGNVPLQINTVNQFIYDAVVKLVKIYKPDDKEENNHLDMMKYIQSIVTGHSLGAILADYNALNATASITFENPGSKPIILSALIGMKTPPAMISVQLNRLKNTCQAYQAGVNLINTCNEQVGRTFRIGNLDYDFGSPVMVTNFPPSSSYLLNPAYQIYNTLEQHSIDKIANYMLSGKPTTEIINPIGFQAGYIEYLNPSNEHYWDMYMNKVWESPLSDTRRLLYNNDKDYFKYSSRKELTDAYNAAKASVILINQPNEKLLHPQLNLFKPAPKDTDQIIEEFTLVEKPTPSRCSIM